MQHTCQDCDHVFNEDGQNGPHIQPATQCPNCHSYRTQPSGQANEMNDMVHGLQSMPTSTQDDMSGNPLKEGILSDGGWKNRTVRDEAFASVRAKVSLFEMPEFETTQIVAPPDLYRHGLETEAAHRAEIQTPKGITDNLHAALGNLGAWVENPYEDGALRPYSNKYWKTIRPEFSKPGSIQIGVADPIMAEIINHVARTDDITPLYEYRGRQSHTKTAGPLAALAPEALAGGADAGIAAGLAGSGDAAASAGASSAGSSAGGIGGIMKNVMQGAPMLNAADDVFGLGGSGGGAGAAGGGSVPTAPHDFSFYTHTASEDEAYPDSHGEIPKQEDGDYHEQDDGNHHEWQRDISVNDVGGTDHSPSFDPGGPAFERFLMLAPLLLQMIQNGEDGSQDPLVQGLHQALESELPGYLDHADDNAAHELLMVLSPQKPEDKDEAAQPEKNDPDHTDENSGGGHVSKVAHLDGEAAEFLPDFTVVPPSLNGAHLASPIVYEQIAQLRAGLPADIQHEIDDMLLHDGPKVTMQYLQQNTRGQPTPRNQGTPFWDALGADSTPLGGFYGKTAEVAWTNEQIAAVQRALAEQGADMETILSVATNPTAFSDLLAQIQHADDPPTPPDDAGMSANPPMPAQENAPPSATMPVPPMQQMMGAVERYAADSVATACPKCHGHTTALIDEDGTSSCHGCGNIFKTKGKHPNKIDTTASTWNVDEDLPREAATRPVTAAPDLHDLGVDDGDAAPVQGVPIADQTHQRDRRDEQDSGHTWTDEDGNPLKVGQEYEMYSAKYDIPDLVRVEAVKPNAIVYTLTGEFGLEKSDELTREEANIEHLTFRPTDQQAEVDSAVSLEENNDDNTAYQGSPERTDASAPTGLVASVKPQLAWLAEGGFGTHTAGANYTPMEQRALIDERGMARNADRLDLANTHYIQDPDEDQFLFGF